MGQTPFTIKKGSNGDKVFYQLDPVIDMTGATVSFTMTQRGASVPKIASAAATVASGTYIIDGVSTVYAPTQGVVFYDWAGAADLDTPGIYSAEWSITKDGKSHKRPSEGYETIIIEEDLPL